MEKTISFKIFKEKIIKTDELISVVNQKEESLMKAHKWAQHFKTKVELSKNEINKLKLRNETLIGNLNLTEKNYKCLQQEHDQLQLQNNKFERECSNTINDLQIKYQLTSQELKEYKEKVTALEGRLVHLNENESLPLEVKKSATKKRKVSPKKKEITTENKNENKRLLRTITELQSEKEKLITEKTDLTLQAYEVKKELQNLRYLQDDNTKFKEIEDKLKIKEQEITALKEKLNNCLEEKNKEIDKLSKSIKNMEIENNKLQVENEKLKEENCSYQVEISMLSAPNTVQNGSEKGPENGCTEYQLVADRNTSVCQEQVRENTKSPTDEEISTIMQQMFLPTKVTPLPTFSEADHDNAKLSPGTYGNKIQSSPHKVNPDLKNIVIRRRNLRKKKRFLVRQKSKQVDLFGALLALKQANINFIISSDSCMQPPRTLSHLIRPKKLIKRSGACTVTKELSCSLSCCKNSYMVLKDCGEGAPLLGFVGVKNEVTSQQEFMREETSSLNFLKWAQCQSLAKKRKKMINCNCEKRTDNKSKNASSQDEFVEAGVEEICGKEKECSERKSQLQKSYKKLDSGQNTRLSVENETDEGYSSYRRENTPPPQPSIVTNKTPDSSPQVRRSKRTSSSILSVIKKKKVGLNNKLRLTRSYDSVVDDEEENSKIVPQKNTSNTSDSSHIEQIETRKAPNKTTSPKTSFKRPLCRTRRSQRLQHANTTDTDTSLPQEEMTTVEDNIPEESPQSPTPTRNTIEDSQPTLIPLDKAPEKNERMPPSKIEVLFNKLIVYSAEEEALNEVAREFATQEPEYIAEAILERVAVDYHDAPDTKYNPAPLMTDVQRTMLGFMSKLEKSNMIGVFDNYLALAEQRILCCTELQQFGPITRLYLGICKLQKKLSKMRRLCCDVFYFCGDFAVPFLFMVLTSWTEILPREGDSKDMPIARVLVQIVYMKDCNKPGYNLLPLRDLLTKFYGYPAERWDVDEFFKELFYAYLRNPVRSSDFALLLYCRNRPEKWVDEKIEEHLKPIVLQDIAENFKATLIILIGNLYNRFSSKSEINYLPNIRKWFSSLVTETTSDVVKKSVYLCLNRLKKK